MNRNEEKGGNERNQDPHRKNNAFEGRTNEEQTQNKNPQNPQNQFNDPQNQRDQQNQAKQENANEEDLHNRRKDEKGFQERGE